MAIRIVKLGSARTADEGPRLGTVRRPPRGVPGAQFAPGNCYSFGCYCEDEARCHRSLLLVLLAERGAAIAPDSARNEKRRPAAGVFAP